MKAYKNGREAKENDPVVGVAHTGPEVVVGRLAILPPNENFPEDDGAIVAFELEPAGRSVSVCTIAEIIHAEDAWAASLAYSANR